MGVMIIGYVILAVQCTWGNDNRLLRDDSEGESTDI